MFKQIFRITFITLVWKQNKQLIVSTLILFGYLWLVGSLHADYLNYAELLEDQSVAGRSFVLKWAALAGGVLIYLGYHFVRGSRRRKIKAKEITRPGGEKEKIKLMIESEKAGPDPFAGIRAKQHLRSRAEMMIDKSDQE
ncbi:MAG: hypothetical protein HKN85_02270 [Gammaproteobacteria bacterium]|nr:hypothetical protein [Gammaproteobacteria bacterium]